MTDDWPRMPLDWVAKQADGLPMIIFKCPHCQAKYELIMTHVSFRQRSYANCQKCWKTMYSWHSLRVPRFKLLQPADRPQA